MIKNKKLKKDAQPFGLDKMVTFLGLKGFGATETRELLDTLFVEIANQLEQGHPVILKEVCTLKPIFGKAEVLEIGGKPVQAGNRINLKVRISEVFRIAYRDKNDPEKQIAEGIDAFRKTVKVTSKK